MVEIETNVHSNSKLRVVQCWDDGVVSDERLCEILRRHKAKASFNLNAGGNRDQRILSWKYQDEHEVWSLSWAEMPAIYDGFTIANHSLTHPHPTEIPLEAWRYEVEENRKRLQDHFAQPVLGFAYPFGNYNEAVMEVVRETGHVYARTCENQTPSFPVADAMAQPTDCHFLASDFWDRYEKAKADGDVFYFWGHSYEMTSEAMWADFEAKISRISTDSQAQWADLPELFSAP